MQTQIFSAALARLVPRREALAAAVMHQLHPIFTMPPTQRTAYSTAPVSNIPASGSVSGQGDGQTGIGTVAAIGSEARGWWGVVGELYPTLAAASGLRAVRKLLPRAVWESIEFGLAARQLWLPASAGKGVGGSGGVGSPGAKYSGAGGSDEGEENAQLLAAVSLELVGRQHEVRVRD